MVKDLVVTRSILLHADAPKVWDVITNPLMVKQYMNQCMLSTNWQKEGSMEWRNDSGEVIYKGIVMDVVPGRQLAYSYFDPHSGAEDHPSSYVHVTYMLTPKGNLTELLVTLTNFGGDDTRAEHAAAFWDFEIMPRIKQLAENTVEVDH